MCQVSHLCGKCEGSWEEEEMGQQDQVGRKASIGAVGGVGEGQAASDLHSTSTDGPAGARGEGWPWCLPGVWSGLQAGGCGQMETQ